MIIRDLISKCEKSPFSCVFLFFALFNFLFSFFILSSTKVFVFLKRHGGARISSLISIMDGFGGGCARWIFSYLHSDLIGQLYSNMPIELKLFNGKLAR